MNKKHIIFFNIITIFLPIIFCWLIPMFVVEKLNKIAQMTYNPYPRFLTDSIIGILLGLLLSFLWFQYISKPIRFIVGFLVALIITLLLEINLYTNVIIINGSTGNAILIHLFLGMYLYLFIYSIIKRNHDKSR